MSVNKDKDSTSIGTWADIASAIVGAPPGFKLFRHSPLGWAPRKHGPLAEIDTTKYTTSYRHKRKQTTLENIIQRNWPAMWFSFYTPCPRHYELKHCRRVLTDSTVEAIHRALHRNHQQQQQQQQQNRRYRDRAQNYHASANGGKSASHDEMPAMLSKSMRNQFARLAFRMASDQKIWMLRIVAYVTTKLLQWLFGSDLYIDETGVECVKTLQKTHTLIYTPTHRSHLDSVVMGYVMFSSGLEPAHIVAGDNLCLPIISYLMRASGAVFIRRSNKDVKDRDVYKKTLVGFIEGLLSHGKHLEFFIEGGRARDGCILEPKLGILAHVVDAFIDADLPKEGNVAIVPVNISYDHPLEEHSLIQELMGCSKKPETSWSFFKSLFKMLVQCCFHRLTSPGVGGKAGCATVAFGKPLHLKMLLRSLSRGVKGHRHRGHLFRSINTGQQSLNRNDVLKAAFPFDSDERYRAVSVLGQAVHTQLKSIQVIPASSILYCALYLVSFRKCAKARSLDLSNVIMAVDQLQRLLKRNNALFIGFSCGGKSWNRYRMMIFLKRLDQWIAVQEDTKVKIIASMESSVVFYLRSNHLLVKIAPTCLVISAVMACIQGFGQKKESLTNHYQSLIAPRQADFVSVPFARRSHIVTATLWLREILSPELDQMFGEKGFRTQAEIQDCLDRMLNDGLLTFCIPPSTCANRQRSSSINSSNASGGRRKSVDHVVDKLIFDVVEDMEVRGRASMQFESDLKKCRNDEDGSNVSKLPRIKSTDNPTQAADEILQNISENKTSKIADNIALDGGSDVYSLIYSPLIATYEFLFGMLLRLFEVKDHYEEKELVTKLMEALTLFWNNTKTTFDDSTPHENLCLNPIPSITIVQRFVTLLKTWKAPKKDFPFSPYPMLMNGSHMPVTSRPPRPSFGNEFQIRRPQSEAALGQMISDSETNEAIATHIENRPLKQLLQLRHEFREGHTIREYQDKLSIFIPYQN